MKRRIDSFLKILSLDKVKVEKEALRQTLVPYDTDYWVKIGTLTKDELRLFAVANWCGKMSDKMADESGVIEFCSEELRKALEYKCDQKDDNCMKLKMLQILCNNYLSYLMHERLYITMIVPLLVFEDFAVCYYEPGYIRPERGIVSIPAFASN